MSIETQLKEQIVIANLALEEALNNNELELVHQLSGVITEAANALLCLPSDELEANGWDEDVPF